MTGNFVGGIHSNERKFARAYKIESLPLPDMFYLSLKQHVGPEMQPLVKKGDIIKKYSKLAKSEGFCISYIHSPCNGVVEDIIDWPYMAGSKVKAIVINRDNSKEEDPKPEPESKVNSFSSEQILEKIKDAGVVGLGGAMFPSYFKLTPNANCKIDTLIINGAECEPYITADHRLMIEQPFEILKGIQIMQKIFPVRVIIALEDNKKDAASKLYNEIKKNNLKNIKIHLLKTKYPQGGEKNIIKSVLGRAVPSRGLPSAIGCVVQNIATCKAIYDAVYLNKPLIERIVTFTGDQPQQKNYVVRIGTLLNHVMVHAGLSIKPERIIIGGPMMGFPQSTLDAPLVKGNNCIIIQSKAMDYDEQECISCSRCVDVCPMFLMPNMIVKASKSLNHSLAQERFLFDCYECGCCAYVCPSKINHIKWFRMSKKIQSVKKK
jgi:Na+-translocating ferredoxin:NAD+ oxidoreductase subunit C